MSTGSLSDMMMLKKILFGSLQSGRRRVSAT